MKRTRTDVILFATFAVFFIAVFYASSLRSAPVPLPDANWPVTRHPTEASLQSRIEALSQLVKKIEAKKLDASYARSALVLAKDFIVYAADDEKNGRPGRAAYVRSYLDEALDAAIAEAKALIANPKLNRPVPRPRLKDIQIRNGAFFAGNVEVMFGGMGHFGQVRRDLPKFSDYGFNLIQIEIGPNSVVTGPNPGDISTDAIDNDIAKVLDEADRSGVMVNLLLSPHYFPQWATDLHPELKKCGRGFLQYCVSDPYAREVLKRYLETLIPRIKDKPALQSYTLANEPNFFEAGDATAAQFREALQKKYGTISALNRAWRKGYSSFDKIKPSIEIFLVNATARLDWSGFHYAVCTDFFAWMTSVIRTMDPKTPVHIKFMDDMFADEETIYGIDRESLEKFTEISGNDSTIRYPGENGYGMRYRQNAAFYDFLKSVQPEKPVQNSETHVISDDSQLFFPESYIRASLWSMYVHGMAASTMWVWERGDTPSFGNDVLTRPNCAAAVARVTLDMRRLAPYITALSNSTAVSPLAVYYSQSTRALELDFLDRWDPAYEIAVYQGWPVRMIPDSAVDAGLDPKRIPVLFIPEYIYTTDALNAKLIEYVRSGGRVVTMGSVFRINEFEKQRSTTEWAALSCDKPTDLSTGCVETLSSAGKTSTDLNFALLHNVLYNRFGVPRPLLRITDPDGAPVLGVEYRSVRFGNKRLAYVLNSLDHAANVRLVPTSGKWQDTIDLATGKKVKSSMRMEAYDLLLFFF